MIKVDMISGFLGAGKTTLIKKLFSDCFGKEKVVLIENEFGEIGIDGTFLKESGVEIKEINSGCICCSLVGDFSKSMKEVVEKFAPDRIIIEPSGVGKLSDIIRAVEKVGLDLKINVVATVVDGGKCKMYHKNFGEFYNDQVKEANTVVVSKTDKLTDEKIRSAVELIREINPKATIVTTPIARLDGGKLLETLESDVSMVEELLAEIAKEPEHHHHHHDHDDECCCGEHEEEHEHHHDHDDGCCCGEHEEEHEHHHHHHDDECCCGEHEEEREHHHDHDDECCCGEHEEEHEHHH
ncbi:MAG: GTP-binding protein, partial [Candidatus Borkfalkiaceae bacterium]|nr:GTP-binding protein [Christensenellaceae bacterium]